MAQAKIEENATVDARGLQCPMPIVKMAKAVKGLEVGQVAKLISTDRGAIADVPAWSDSTGNELIEWHEEGADLVFFVRKA